MHIVVFVSVTLMSRQWANQHFKVIVGKKHIENIKRQNEKSFATPIVSFCVKFV